MYCVLIIFYKKYVSKRNLCISISTCAFQTILIFYENGMYIYIISEFKVQQCKFTLQQ